MVPPEAVVLKLIAVVPATAWLQTVWVVGNTLPTGLGFTVIVAVAAGPVQPTLLAV